jgi:putative oxidoreductase
MKYVILIVRILLGLLFVFSGANILFHLSNIPPMQGDAGAFMGAVMHSGYIYPIAALQLLGGLCLIIHPRLVALGLTLLGPVIFNIVLFHVFLDRSGLIMAVIVSAAALFLLWVYRFKFPAIFQP